MPLPADIASGLAALVTVNFPAPRLTIAPVRARLVASSTVTPVSVLITTASDAEAASATSSRGNVAGLSESESSSVPEVSVNVSLGKTESSESAASADTENVPPEDVTSP